MPKTIARFLALLLSLAAPASALAQQGPLAAIDPDAVSAVEAAADPDEFAPDEVSEEEHYDEEEYLDEDIEFCGGGEVSLLDEVWDENEYGDAGVAYDLLVDALRTGEIEDWERGRALALLAEMQLERGEPGRAIVNFQRAERVEPGVTDPSRTALATALLLRGERRQALDEAQAAHEELCDDQYAVAGCYTANLILARTARRADERTAALQAARTLRDANPDLADAFDRADAQVAGS